jgi:hypothetical protein
MHQLFTCKLFQHCGKLGTGATQIGPGSTVHLCGTISTTLTVPTSVGVGGNPIEVLFESSATISTPASNGINIKGSSNNWIVDGGGVGGTNGSIQNTANGSNLAQQVSVLKGIDISGTTGTVEIRNIAIFNQYVHKAPITLTSMNSDGTTTVSAICATTCGFVAGEKNISVSGNSNSAYNLTNNSITVKSTSGDTITLTYPSNVASGSGTGGQISEQNATNNVNAIYSNNVKANVTIHDSVFHDACWSLNLPGVTTNSPTVEIYNVDAHNNDHDFIVGSNGTNWRYKLHDSHSHDHTNWDTVNNQYHHDGLHIFGLQGDSLETDVYNMLFDGPWDGNGTAPIFIQHSVNNLNFFNNVLLCTSGCTDVPPLAEGLGGNNQLFVNNTVMGTGSVSNTACVDTFLDTGATSSNNTFMNNVSTGCTTLFQSERVAYATNSATSGLDFNIYADPIAGGNKTWFWEPYPSGTQTATDSFTTWLSVSGEGSHSQSVSSAGLSSTGVPQTGSVVLGAGTNLTSLCTGSLIALCKNTSAGNTQTPAARPATGAWNAGAY